ncbi:MAG: hypothetical protein R2800_07935 [Flavipsychrobacter sp.]
MEERLVLTNGYRWIRWLFVPIGFGVLLELVNTDGYTLLKSGILLGCILFYFIFWSVRKIRFDNTNLYVIKGNREKLVPLKNIKKLAKSRAKVNGERFWIITFEEDHQEKKLRYFSSFINGNNKTFKAAIQKANPDVVIWEHPFFNH